MTKTKEDKSWREPGKRIGHVSVGYKGLMLVWGGYNDEHTHKYLPSDEIWFYDPLVEKWFKKSTGDKLSPDDIPPGTSGASGAVIDDYLYVFGGYTEEANTCDIYRLNLKTLKWEKLQPKGQAPTPCDKSTGWVFNDKVYVFGGYGIEPHPSLSNVHQRDSQFLGDQHSHWHYQRGWNNQFACYDPATNEWSWPRYGGSAPSPRAAHAVAQIENRIYVMGGRNGTSRLNDLHVINMETMSWSCLNTNNPPEGRSWHSFTAISSDEILLYGGFSQKSQPLRDCWLLFIPTMSWVLVNLGSSEPRLWHTAVLSPFDEVLIYGGGTENILNRHLKNVYTGDLITLRFSPKSLLRLSLDASVANANLLQQNWPHLPHQMQKLLWERSQMGCNQRDSQSS